VITRIQKWGNSQGLRLAREILAEAGLDVGDAVDVSVRDGAVLIVSARRVRGAVALEALVKQLPADHEPQEFDWGRPHGREVW
jgi:antitoxin MazE